MRESDLNFNQKLGRSLGTIALGASLAGGGSPIESKGVHPEQDNPPALPTEIAFNSFVDIATPESLPNSDFAPLTLPTIEIFDPRLESILRDYRNKQLSMNDFLGFLTDEVSIQNIQANTQNTLDFLSGMEEIDIQSIERRFVVLPTAIEGQLVVAPIFWNTENNSLLFLYERETTLEGGNPSTTVMVGSLQDHDGEGDNSRIIFRADQRDPSNAFFFTVDANGENPQYTVMTFNENDVAVETPIDEVTLGPEIVGTPPAPEIAMAPAEAPREVNALLVNGAEILGSGIEKEVDGQPFTIFTNIPGFDLTDFDSNILKEILPQFGSGYYREGGEGYSQGETFDWFDGIPTEIRMIVGQPTRGEYVHTLDIPNTSVQNDVSNLPVRLENGKRIITTEFTLEGFNQWLSSADPNNTSELEFRARGLFYDGFYNAIAVNSQASQHMGLENGPGYIIDRTLRLDWDTIWDRIATSEGINWDTADSATFDYSVIWESAEWPEAYRLLGINYNQNSTNQVAASN